MAQWWCETTASGRSKGSRDRRGCQLWLGCPLKEVRQAGGRVAALHWTTIRELKRAAACAPHCPAAEMQPTVPLESF